jgi:hypothetical protein
MPEPLTRLLESLHDAARRAALPAMPLGVALWMLGSAEGSYVLAAGGLLAVILGAFFWTEP